MVINVYYISIEALSHIPAFMKLGFPSAVMVCLELWSFKLLVLLSGLFPNPVLETSTLSICLNTSLTLWMIPVGLGGTARVRYKLGYAFSSDPKVISYVASMIPNVAAGNFLDGFQCVLSGVARGCGWQKIGACVNLGSYYLAGGLWLGIVTALAVQVLSLSTITLVTNWDKEAKKVKDIVGSSDKEVREAEASII
ncbi:hypothetical protein Bca52824_027834 [Brassica carinata]|uniref:Protein DETOXIFICATION n=1 Tax=Brassica carinata TaxID=52824 RepID=A0A8X7VB69_BRACI|nr:hypothetical protein Bca52824_027834 [Brassica carinata]